MVCINLFKFWTSQPIRVNFLFHLFVVKKTQSNQDKAKQNTIDLREPPTTATWLQIDHHVLQLLQVRADFRIFRQGPYPQQPRLALDALADALLAAHVHAQRARAPRIGVGADHLEEGGQDDSQGVAGTGAVAGRGK